MKKRNFLTMCVVVSMILMTACGKKEEPSVKESDIEAVEATSLEEQVETDGEEEGSSEVPEENVPGEVEETVEEVSAEVTGNPEDYEYQLRAQFEDEILIGFNLPEGTWEVGTHSLIENNVYARIELKRSDSGEREWLSLEDGFTLFGYPSYWNMDENGVLAVDEEIIKEIAEERNYNLNIVELEKKESVDTVFGTMDIYFVKEECEYLDGTPFTLVSGYEWGIMPVADNYVSVRWGDGSYSVQSTDNPQWEQQRDDMQYQGTLKNDILPQMFEVE